MVTMEGVHEMETIFDVVITLVGMVAGAVIFHIGVKMVRKQ